MDNEIALGTMGRYIDNLIKWQFSELYIAIPMIILELFIIYFIYRRYFVNWRDP